MAIKYNAGAACEDKLLDAKLHAYIHDVASALHIYYIIQWLKQDYPTIRVQR